MLEVLVRQASGAKRITEEMVSPKGEPPLICLRYIIKKKIFNEKFHYCIKKNLYSNCAYCNKQHNTCDKMSALKRNVFRANFETDCKSPIEGEASIKRLYWRCAKVIFWGKRRDWSQKQQDIGHRICKTYYCRETCKKWTSSRKPPKRNCWSTLVDQLNLMHYRTYFSCPYECC